MPRNILYTASAVAILMFALGFYLLPSQMLDFYGVTIGEGGIWLARFMASVQVGNVFLLWMLRNAVKSRETDMVSWAIGIAWGLTGVFSLLATIAGVFNAVGWGMLLLCILFTAGFWIDTRSD